MSNGSSTAFLVWAILATLFLLFLIYHLWSYDKFQCLRWNAGRQPGAFKRVMTYSYLMTLPLLVVFSIGILTLKLKEGWIVLPGGEVFPKPVQFWNVSHQHTLLSLFFVFSIGWALELVTHFEELAFWLFVLDQGPTKREWFSSWEYRMWYLGCVAAILGMPITTLAARHDLNTIDAWIFLVGSLGSTTTNVAFLYVLFRFPSFLKHVKAEGAEPDVVVRLTTFYELNLLRVLLRFVAGISLLILAADGIRGRHDINRSLFWSDLLLVLAAIGQFVSSAITLLIFFPRSFAAESGYHNKAPSTDTRSISTFPLPISPISPKSPEPVSVRVSMVDPTSPSDGVTHRHAHALSSSDIALDDASDEPVPGYLEAQSTPPTPAFAPEPHLRPRPHSAIVVVPRGPGPETRLISTSTLHPYVTHFTSPIDLISLSPDDSISNGP